MESGKLIKIIAGVFAVVAVALVVLLAVHLNQKKGGDYSEDGDTNIAVTTKENRTKLLFNKDELRSDATEQTTSAEETTTVIVPSVTTEVNTTKAVQGVSPSSAVSYIGISSYPNTTSYYIGDAFSASGLRVTAYYENGSSANITNQVRVKSPNMYNAGSTDVTVEYTDPATGMIKRTSFGISIAKPSISLSKSSLSLDINDGYSISANTKPYDVYVEWSSASPSIAKVTGNGYVTGVSAGKTSITASFVYNGITYYSNSCTVEVKATPAPTKPESRISAYDVYWNNAEYSEDTLYIYDMDGYVESNYELDYVVVGLIGPVYINGKQSNLNQSFTFEKDDIGGKYFSLNPQDIWGSGEYFDFDIIPGEEYEFYIEASDVNGGWYEEYWTVEL